MGKEIRDKSELPKGFPAIPGLYWETPWYPAHGANSRYWEWRGSRPCRPGLLMFYETLPAGAPFKICFARCEAIGAAYPWAWPTYYPPGNSEHGRPLHARHTFYFRELEAAGLADCPLQWWLEYAEHATAPEGELF